MRLSAAPHTTPCVLSFIGQLLQLLSDGQVKQLRVVLQNRAQVLTRSGPRVERRVQATKLAVARRAGYDSQPPGQRL